MSARGWLGQPCLCPWTGLSREQSSTACFSGADELDTEAVLLASVKHRTLVPVLSKLMICCRHFAKVMRKLQQDAGKPVILLLLYLAAPPLQR